MFKVIFHHESFISTSRSSFRYGRIQLGEKRGDILVVDLLDAAGEGPLVLADLDAQPAYCRGTPNFNCYR